MAYEPPKTALHHLKMAKAYLDEAEATGKDEQHSSRITSEAQVKSLSKAATRSFRSEFSVIENVESLL